MKDPKALPILVPLLDDETLNYKIPWALGEIGGPIAVKGLIRGLANKSPNARVFSAQMLGDLKAMDALPSLKLLLNDNATNKVGQPMSVAEAARAAIAKVERR